MDSRRGGWLLWLIPVLLVLAGNAPAEVPTFSVHTIANWGNELGQTSLVDIDRDGDLDSLIGTIDHFTVDAYRPIPGDANGDLVVDLADLNAVRNNFGASLDTATSTTTDVPAVRDHGPTKDDVHGQRKASDAVFARLAGDDTDQDSGPIVSGLFDELYGARARARRMLWRLR